MGSKHSSNSKQVTTTTVPKLLVVNEVWPEEAQALFNELPDEILIVIFEFVAKRYHKSVRRCCSRFLICCNLANHSFIFSQDGFVSCERVFDFLNIPMRETSEKLLVTNQEMNTSARLKLVDLTKLHISDEQLEHLVTACPQITALKLKFCVKLTSAAFGILSQKAANLKRLDISDTKIKRPFQLWLTLDQESIVMKLTELIIDHPADLEQFYQYLALETTLKKLQMYADSDSVLQPMNGAASTSIEEFVLLVNQSGLERVWKLFPNLKSVVFGTKNQYVTHTFNGDLLSNISSNLQTLALHSGDISIDQLSSGLQSALSLTNLTILGPASPYRSNTFDLGVLEPVIHNLTRLRLGVFNFTNFSIFDRGEKLIDLILDCDPALNVTESDISFLHKLAPQLVIFCFTGATSVPNNFSHMFQLLGKVEIIDVSAIGISTKGANGVLKEISQNTKLLGTLCDLILTSTKISDRVLLEQIVLNAPNLKFLSLCNCHELQQSLTKLHEICDRKETLLIQFNHHVHSRGVYRPLRLM